MKIRQATYEDLEALMEIFEGAKRIMRASGNLQQWNDGYPSREVVMRDIEAGHCYVLCDVGDAGQVGDAGLGAEAADQSGLGMEGGVVSGVDLILVGEHDLSVFHQQRTERLVAVGHSGLRQPNGLFHKSFILMHTAILSAHVLASKRPIT